jgi:hypothetical protein
MSLARGLLSRAELLRTTGTMAVMQTGRSLGIEALDGIVQSLTLHASQAGGLRSGHALESIGNRQQPQAGRGVPLAGSPRAQTCWRVVLTNSEPGQVDLHQQCPCSSVSQVMHFIANASQ